jgi:dsDNA-binding SOS-regulon protein
MIGIRRTFTDRDAAPQADKIIIELTDGTTYKVRANVVSGKTEQQLNDALNLWLSANRPELIGYVGVHLNRDGSLCLWTGELPTEWPEDRVQ